MSNFNYPNSRIYSGHYQPVLIDFNFTVNPVAPSGLGITGLKGAYIKKLFMLSAASVSGSISSGLNTVVAIASTANLLIGMPLSGAGIPVGTLISGITSATAITMSANATGSGTENIIYGGVGSPFPGTGIIAVQLAGQYNGYLYSTASDIGPLSGTNVAVNSTSLTLGSVYTITVLGTSVLADWVAIGVPPGITPAVGVSFIAIQTGSGIGSGQVQLQGASQVTKYQACGGNPSLSSHPSLPPSVLVNGSWLFFQALGSSYTVVAPAVGTQVFIQVLMSDSPLLLGGQ